jgi:hypothetical protein
MGASEELSPEIRRLQADFPYLQEIQIRDPLPDAHLTANPHARAQGNRTFKAPPVTEADELAARLNSGPRSKFFVPPRAPAVLPELTRGPPASARPPRELQISLDHAEVKRKVESLEIQIRESLYDSARRLRKITDRELRKQARAKGPTYHFWRELTGLKPLGDLRVIWPS